jgi:hypothetical protein
VVWENPIPLVGEGDVLCWGEEDSPLEVAPLAMAVPCTDMMEVAAHQQTPVPGDSSPVSPWVVETMTEFGLVLGASFEGYEEDLMSILKAIEDRRKQKGKDKKKVSKSEGKEAES